MARLKQKIVILYGELRRRKVINTFMLYVISCWVILQVSTVFFPLFEFEDDYYYWLLGLFILIFPIVICISWMYDFIGGRFVRIGPMTERRLLHNINPLVDRRVSLSKDKSHKAPTCGWFVEAQTGPIAGLEFYVSDKPIVVGRAIDCELTLLRSHVSRNHARLQVMENRLFVEDLGSSNGTYVNGAKISEMQQLYDGDEIRLKDIIFTVIERATELRDEELLNQTSILRDS